MACLSARSQCRAEFSVLGGPPEPRQQLEDGGRFHYKAPKSSPGGSRTHMGTQNCQPEVEIRTSGHEKGPRGQPTSSWNCGEGCASRPSGAALTGLQMVNGPLVTPSPRLPRGKFKNLVSILLAREAEAGQCAMGAMGARSL